MLLSVASALAAAADDNTAASAVLGVADAVSRTKPNDEAFSKFADLASSQPLGTPTLSYGLPLALVVTGFFLHIAIEMWSDKGLNFKPHFVRLIVFTLAVNAYVPLSRGISGFVLSLGAVSPAGVSRESAKTKTFLAAQRTKYFEQKKEMEAEIASLNKQAAEADANRRRREGLPEAESESPGFIDGALSGLNAKIDTVAASLFFSVIQMSVELSFLFASVAIFFLKMLQSAMMNVILGVGPLMIAFSSWPGVTSRYFSAWASALIETAAWGVFSGTLIRLLASNAENRASSSADGGLFEFVGLNILYAASLISVPAITSSVLRGSAAGGSMMSGMLAASTSTAMRVAQVAQAGGGKLASAAKDALSTKKEAGPSVEPEQRSGSAADTAFKAPPDPDPRRDFFRNQAANKNKDEK